MIGMRAAAERSADHKELRTIRADISAHGQTAVQTVRIASVSDLALARRRPLRARRRAAISKSTAYKIHPAESSIPNRRATVRKRELNLARGESEDLIQRLSNVSRTAVRINSPLPI
jgi:hypothetical protein